MYYCGHEQTVKGRECIEFVWLGAGFDLEGN